MNPLVTALEEEGFTDVLSNHVVESFARHLMVALDSWQEAASAQLREVTLSGCRESQGVRRDIDDNGDLLIRRVDKADVVEKRFCHGLNSRPGSIPRQRGHARETYPHDTSRHIGYIRIREGG